MAVSEMMIEICVFCCTSSMFLYEIQHLCFVPLHASPICSSFIFSVSGHIFRSHWLFYQVGDTRKVLRTTAPADGGQALSLIHLGM